MNKVLSLMKRFHVRLDSLEANMKEIFDVEIPVKDTDSLLSVNITCSIKKQVKDELVQFLKTNVVTKGTVFTSPRFAASKIWIIREIELTEELLFRRTSNGLNCDLVICKGVARGRIKSQFVNMALKFRKVEQHNIHFSEQEALHTLDVDRNTKLCQLFPILYCLGKVIIEPRKGIRQIWECIGTEIMDEIPWSRVLEDPSFFYDCFNLLKKMHAYGYVHGDAHCGNFMQTVKTKAIIMIDQDEVKPLHVDPVFSKFMQIMDYAMLMYWNNPFIGVYKDIQDLNKISEDNAALLFFKSNNRMSVLYPPFFGSRYLNWTLEDCKRLLDNDTVRHPVTKKTYWQFVDGLNMADIDAMFEITFKSTKKMKMINLSNKKILISKGYKIPIQKWEIIDDKPDKEDPLTMVEV